MDGFHRAAINPSAQNAVPKDRVLLIPDDGTPGSTVHHRTTELQMSEWQQRDAVLGLGHLSQNAKGKSSTHTRFNLSFRNSFASAVSASGGTHAPAPAPAMRGAINKKQFSAALLMWDSAHFSVSSQMGIEEHVDDRESARPWCTCRYLSAQRRPQTN